MSTNLTTSEEDIFITDTGAFRTDTSLFSILHSRLYQPSPICLQSGVKVKPESEKTTLSTGSVSISIYLTQQHRNKTKWDSVLVGKMYILLLLMLIIACMAIHAYLMLGIIIPALIYGSMTPKNHRIRVQQQDDGLIEILNVNQDFLSYFPIKANLK